MINFQSRPKIIRHFFLSILLLLLIAHTAFAANLLINLVAVNGTSETKAYPVKYYLPEELEPNDIVNAAGLEIDYDLNKKAYYLHGTVQLAPKESRTLKVEVRDVWQVTPEEVDILKEQLADNVGNLEGTEFYEGAQVIKERMERQLDRILQKQEEFTDNIERRVEHYRTYVNVLDEIRDSAFSVDQLKKESRGIEGSEERAVRFLIEIKNPENKEKTFSQKHYLPEEVEPQDVLEPQGFDIRFDKARQQSYLTREETLSPGEEKRYEVVIRDVWKTPEGVINSFRDQAESIYEELEGSEYESRAEFLFSGIMARLDEVVNSQVDRSDMQEYIGTFRLNEEKLIDIEEDIERLEELLAVVRAKRLEELESGKVENVLQKLQALTGIATLSSAIFGAKPTVTTTWRVIYGLIAFLGLFTAFHFFTWWKRSQVMGEGMGIKPGESVQTVKQPGEESEEDGEGEEGGEEKEES